MNEMNPEQRAIARVIEAEKGYTSGTVIEVRSMEVQTESGGCCCDSSSSELEVSYSTTTTRWNVLYVGSYEVDDFIYKVAAAAFEIAKEGKDGTAQ